MNALALNHLNLPARDPEALSRWYVEKLGFAAHGRFLWSAGTLLVFVQGPPAGSALTHFGFRVGSLAELSEWAQALRDRGVEVGAIDGDASYSTVYVRDPEGNTFELFYEPEPAGDR